MDHNNNPFSRHVIATYPENVIDDIIDYIEKLDHTWKNGESYVHGKLSAIDKYRSCKVSWITDKYIKDFIFNQFLHANKTGHWDYKIDGLENIQYTVYGNKNHYDWHTDYLTDETRCRKLSMSLMLNRVDQDYTGGDFQYRYFFGGEVITESLKLNKGEAIVFNSQLTHRVIPVTSGIRKVLVCWAWGPKWT